MTARWDSNKDEVLRRADLGGRLGIIAAANAVSNAVKKGLKVGYTSGAWTTGASEEAVKVSEPEKQGQNWQIRVGTNLISNLHWEFGHYNLFLRRWVRVEKWRDALVESAPTANRVFGRVYKKTLAGR